MDRQAQVDLSLFIDSASANEPAAVNELAEFQLALVGGGIGDTVL